MDSWNIDGGKLTLWCRSGAETMYVQNFTMNSYKSRALNKKKQFFKSLEKKEKKKDRREKKIRKNCESKMHLRKQ